MYPHLHPGYSVRNPTDADMPAIIQLIYDFDQHETASKKCHPIIFFSFKFQRDWLLVAAVFVCYA